jgi:hypothetical protein
MRQFVARGGWTPALVSAPMRNRAWSIFVLWAFIGGGLLGMACGDATPAPPVNEGDGGTGNGEPPACSVPAPTACPDPAPRYADVAPIFERRCITCHNGTPGGPWALSDYAHISDWQDTVRSNIRDCSMPPPESESAMTLEERVAILTWIRCGLPR